MELAPGVGAVFTGRRGGVSLPPFDELNLSTRGGDSEHAVRSNRAVVESLVGKPVVWMNPEHGAAVAVIGEDADPSAVPPVADILATRRADVALAALAADCVPVLAADPVTGWIAAAHVGREGLRVGAVDALVDFLADTRRRDAAGAQGLAGVRVAIGPAICGRCYEVSGGLRDEVAALHPAAASATRSGAPALDLVAGIEAVLAACEGMRVAVDGRCTLEDEHLFSYRRDGATGRQAGVVWRVGP